MLDSIKGILSEMGWTTLQGCSIAIRNFETAVGKKQCLIYASCSSTTVTLTAEYISEGRNVCSTCWVQISSEDSIETLELKVGAFDADINYSVDASYARGLFLHSATNACEA